MPRGPITPESPLTAVKARAIWGCLRKGFLPGHPHPHPQELKVKDKGPNSQPGTESATDMFSWTQIVFSKF